LGFADACEGSYGEGWSTSDIQTLGREDEKKLGKDEISSNLFKMYACSPSMAMFGIKREDLIPEVKEIVGAATFLEIAAKADVTLFI